MKRHAFQFDRDTLIIEVDGHKEDEVLRRVVARVESMDLPGDALLNTHDEVVDTLQKHVGATVTSIPSSSVLGMTVVVRADLKPIHLVTEHNGMQRLVMD